MNILVIGILLLVCLGHVTSNEEHDGEECIPDIDLIVLLDGSYSVKPHNFDLIKTWVKELAEGMHIGHGHIQIGVIQYSHYYSTRALNNQRYIKTEIKLGQYSDKNRFDAAVDRIRYQGYKTYTAHAIEKTITYDFESEKSRYPAAKRALILLTDGKATDESDLPPVIREAISTKGVVIYAVGVGNYSLSELVLITGNHTDRVFELSDFNDLNAIVADLQEQLKTVCDCHVLGSMSEACDPCSHVCECLPNVVGRRCDQCANGTYGFGAPGGCTECQCNPFGTNNLETCDQNIGQCMCNSAGVGGRDCGECLDGFFGFPACRECDCGGFSTTCDEVTGICESCSSGRRGDHCEICPAGEYMNELSECIPCSCNGNTNSSDPDSCDPNADICLKCLHDTVGDHCETCALTFFGDATNQSCSPCQCNPLGTKVFTSCDQYTGQCMCDSAGVGGRDCGECSDGFFGFPACLECDCGGFSSTCDQVTGICESCSSGRRGDHCEICPAGEYMNELSECIPCTCNGNTNSSDPTSCDPNSGKCLSCLYNTVGDHCEECDIFYYGDAKTQSCKECECSGQGVDQSSCIDGQCACAADGACTCLPDVIGDRCDHCSPGTWGLDLNGACLDCGCSGVGTVDGSTCDGTSGNCECKEGYTGEKCNSCSIGYFQSTSDGTCSECQCSGQGVDQSSCIDGQCACAADGACTCLFDVIGDRCDHCSPGTWGLDSNGSCLDCGCSGVGTVVGSTCDETSGKCECTAEYTGDKCDRCAFGYFQPVLNGPCVAFSANLIEPVGDEEPTPSDDELNEDEGLDSSTRSRDEEPTPTEPTTTESTTTTTTTTTTEATTTTTTTKRITTRKPRRRINPGWSPCTTCGSSGSWPSYCHGWMCRRRWPHHQFQPSPRRCYSSQWGCQASVNYYNGGSRYNYGYHGYNNYYNSYYQPSYNNRRYYHHARPRSNSYSNKLARLDLYMDMKKR